MDRFARALVRWRWAVLVVWAVIGAVAAVRAPATPALLNIRGGSARETEASRTEDLLTRRFSRPIGEFFAVTLEAPAPFDEPAPRAAAGHACSPPSADNRYIRGLVSYPSTGDTTFLSRDRRADLRDRGARGHPRRQRGRAGARRCGQLVKETMARVPGGARYRARVTGRAPLDLDVRTVVTRDSAEGEKRLLPLTLIILVLAFGALVAAALPLVVGRAGDRRLARHHRRHRAATPRCRCSCST